MKRARWSSIHTLRIALCLCAACYGADLRAQAPQSSVAPAAGLPEAAATAAPETEKFDAISIKVDTSGSGRHSMSSNLGGGRLRAVNFSLAGFMVYAYQLPANRILGGPAWFDSEYFDVDATTATEDNHSDNRARIAAMLADRFSLIAHHETRTLPVYALVLDKPGRLGPQLKLTDADCSNWKKTDLSKPNAAATENSTPDDVNCGDTSGSTGNRRVRYLGHGVAMDKLVQVLSGPPSHAFIERPLIDRTGLLGEFDFVLEFTPPQFAPNDAQPSDPSAPPPFTAALRDELGLKLQPAMAPVDVLVIDRVGQPSPN